MKRSIILVFAVGVAISASAQFGIKKELNRISQQTQVQLNQQLRQANQTSLRMQQELYESQRNLQKLYESQRRQKEQAETWKKHQAMVSGLLAPSPFPTLGSGLQPSRRRLSPEENFSSLCHLGIYYYKDNDTTRALEKFDEAIDLSKRIMLRGRENDYLAARYYRGALNDARGDTARTREDFEEVIRLGNVKDESVQYVIQRLMTLFYLQGDYNNVVKKHSILTVGSPEVQDNFTYQIFMAQTQLMRRDIGAACNHLGLAMDYDMDSTLLYVLYYCDSSIGILDSSDVSTLLLCLAEQLAKKIVILPMDALNLALNELLINGQFDNLLAMCETQRSFYSDYPPFLFYQTYAYVCTDESEKVVKSYDKLSSLFKYDSFTYGEYFPITLDTLRMKELENYVQMAKAALYINNGKYAESYDILKELPDSLDNTISDDLLNYAAFFNYAIGGDYYRAIKQYNIIIASAPSADIYASRGYCYYKIAQIDMAKQDFEQVLRLESDSATWNTPTAYYYLNNASMAKRIAKQLLSKDKLSFDDYYYASLFYETIGKERKSFKLFKKAIKQEHDKNIEPLIVLSYESPGLRSKVEKHIAHQQ